MEKKTVQYFCDNKDCGKETTLEDSVAIKIEYSFGTTWVLSSYNRSTHNESRHICKDCAEKLGIVRKIVKDDKVVPEVKSTADELYDVLSRLVWENQQPS